MKSQRLLELQSVSFIKPCLSNGLSMYQRCYSWPVSPGEAGWQQCQAPWAAVLWFVNAEQQRPIDRQNCLLLKATGARGSCHTGPSKCHQLHLIKRTGALSTLRWTSHQAPDFHKQKLLQDVLLLCLMETCRKTRTSLFDTSPDGRTTSKTMMEFNWDWWELILSAVINYFFHGFISPSRSSKKDP